MDEWKRVRELRTEMTVSDEVVDRSRQRLLIELQRAGSTSAARRQRGPWVIPLTVGAGLAAATTAVIVVASLTSPATTIEAVPSHSSPMTPSATPTRPPTPSATPVPLTVQSVFSGASHTVRTSPFPGPGQYLRVEAVNEMLASHNSIDGVNDLSVNRTNAERAWTYRIALTHFIPADLADEWVDVYSTPYALTGFYGPSAQVEGEKWLASVPSPAVNSPLREQGGQEAWWVGSWADQRTDIRLATLFAEMPTDASALTTWLSGYVSEPEKRGWILASLLSYNAGSPELRAAMYEALSALPGADLVHADADSATVMYKTEGGDPAAPDLDWWRSITIDRHTGYVTEYTERLGTNPSLVPDSVPDVRRSFTFTIVDDAP